MTRPLAKLALARRVRITVDVDPTIATLLDVTATHLGKTRDETIADALRALFVALPRPGAAT
jgi:metal-responsive CopG/Arc/MetJ family transcriptional regulator